MQRKDHDLNTGVAGAVARMTGTRIPRGEDLTDNPELKRKYIEARDKEIARQKRENKARP
jgi:hypothetical protein